MEIKLKNYHKEYSCIPEIVEKEYKRIQKRFFRNKLFWVVYMVLFLCSILLLPLWMTFLMALEGFILFPVSRTGRKAWLKEKPFLVIDSKYIQFKGKMVPWNSVTNIIIQHEIFNKRNFQYNYNIYFKYANGKEACIDTYYFKEQEEILNGIKALAHLKEIPLNCHLPKPLPYQETV